MQANDMVIIIITMVNTVISLLFRLYILLLYLSPYFISCAD